MVGGNGESVGDRVRRLRQERGLSQRDAAGPGVSAAYISRIEKGARRPSVTALRALARNLGVTPEYLETGSELAAPEQRDMRLADAELELRLGDDPGSSEATFRELLQEAVEAGDESVELRSRIGLGLVALHRGDARGAVSLLEAVIEHVSVTPLTHPDVYLTLGRSYAEIGRAADAVALFRDGLDEIDRSDPGNHTAYIRFATYLSYALADRGDLAGAQLAVADALARADDVADPYAKIRLYWSQARVAADQGQSSVALAHIRRAIALLETTEDTLHLGRAHLVSAEILLAAERLDDAERQLALAEHLLGSRAEALDLAVLRSEQAKLLARRGRATEAIAAAEDSLRLFGGQNEPERGRGVWALAESLAAAGRLDEALVRFSEAEALVRDEGRYTASVLRAWGGALRAAGRFEEALTLLDRAAAAGISRVAAGSR